MTRMGSITHNTTSEHNKGSSNYASNSHMTEISNPIHADDADISINSDATSFESESGAPLFPTINQQYHDKSPRKSSRRSISTPPIGFPEKMDDTSSSIHNMGEVFRRNVSRINLSHANDDNTNNNEYVHLGSDHSTSASEVDSISLDSISPPLNHSRISLESSIINQVIHQLAKEQDQKQHPHENQHNADRFKYLSAYTELKQQQIQDHQVSHIIDQMKNHQHIPLNTVAHSQSHESKPSVFELSNLDDYNKYIRMTELNERIKQKANSHQDSNLLSVIPSNHLARHYTEATPTPPPQTLRSRKLSPSDKLKINNWYSWDWSKKKSQQQFELEDLKYQVSPSSSSDQNIDSLSSPHHQQQPSSQYARSKRHQRRPQYLQRKLKVRHLQMISFGGTLGVGLFLNSGKALTIAGGFGTLLAYVICGIIVLTTIMSFCEMVTFISVVDGVSGLSSRFVDDSFGFATGWLYFFSFAFGLAGEVVASVILLTYFPELHILDNKGSLVGFVTFFLVVILLANLVDVRVFGEIEYVSSLIKLICALLMIVAMIILNRGGIGQNKSATGFKYWQYSKSDFDHNIIFGLFRPGFNLADTGTNDPHEGVLGNTGRFCSLIAAIMVVAYAYSGTEIVCIAACEAKNPRVALPSATRRVFWRILVFFCLSSFLVSLNLYAGDPRLLRYYSGGTGADPSTFATNYAIKHVGGNHCDTNSTIFAGFGSGSQSPWTVALQSAGLCQFSSVANGFLVFFAVSCGNAQLYVSSRTLYSLALQKKAPSCMAYCNRNGIPYNSVLFSAAFGLLAFLCVSEKATTVFQNLTSLIASSGIMVWFSMNLSFLRFYYGLKIRPDIISRDDKSYPYRSPWQPYSACVGLFGSSVILLGMGFAVFFKHEWDTLYFFSSYGTLIIFAVLYVGYRFVRGTRIHSLETLDFDSGRREMDRYIWDGGREYNSRNFKEVAHKVITALA